MNKTGIEWTEKTWNPVTGCSPVSEGCKNCYAARMAKRLAGRAGYPKDNPFAVTFHEDRLDEPLKLRKPAHIFVCSMADLFHDDVLWTTIDKIMAVAAVSNHLYQILTKRSKGMRQYVESRSHSVEFWKRACPAGYSMEFLGLSLVPFPLPNIWLGVTAENQARADERIPDLLATPAALRFVSVEPMLGPVDLTPWLKAYPRQRQTCAAASEACPNQVCDCPRLGWIICGPETGPGARPCNPEWVDSLFEQCRVAGVPFFFKGDDPRWPKERPEGK